VTEGAEKAYLRFEDLQVGQGTVGRGSMVSLCLIGSENACGRAGVIHNVHHAVSWSVCSPPSVKAVVYLIALTLPIKAGSPLPTHNLASTSQAIVSASSQLACCR